VREGEREILLPFIHDVIAGVDKARGCIHIHRIPGLL
jgi:ribosomal 30S subunit maturation factor RimM